MGLSWDQFVDRCTLLSTQWGATPLEDNVPSDSYYYQLAVYTGVRKGAGTRSKRAGTRSKRAGTRSKRAGTRSNRAGTRQRSRHQVQELSLIHI